ncbi:GAF and ANTAR domain-containing protein [Pseudarthrobacter sp. NPDC058362]|uniref:GAF and ANTAR domain-containing protein n=1 Tax=Pseudarthrobacter sp. NPDC058362 TaxID=3346458 RepID=UPI0036521BAA
MPHTAVPHDRIQADVALHLQNLVLESGPVVDVLLSELARYAAATLGADGSQLVCGIRLDRHKKASVVAGSDPAAQLLDQLEGRFGGGPGMTAVHTHSTVNVPDLRGERLWPEYAAAAGNNGFLAVLSVPLKLEDGCRGVLNVYGREAGAFDRNAVAAADALVQQASKGLSLVLRMAKLEDTREGMSAAMQSRTVIDLATGAIMAQNRCGQDSAFRVLQKASNTRNMKLRDVAAAVVASIAGGAKTFTYFDE